MLRYATPLVFQLDAELRPLRTPWAAAPLSRGWWMADPSRVQAAQQELRAQQDAGRHGGSR